MKPALKYVYGPVPSWRLGSSLGIDPISQEKKVCSFDCLYCQLGKTAFFSDERKVFVPVSSIIEELDSLPPLKIDYITFSGAGEPTLAENLGEMIKAVKKIRKDKIAVITNSSLLYRQDVRQGLLCADLVVAKLDACSREIFETINQPIGSILFDDVVSAIKKFKNIYKGKLAIQVMCMEKNRKCAEETGKIIAEIAPDEIQVNTPLRPCGVKPLAKEELSRIKTLFNAVCQGKDVISVYDKITAKDVVSISDQDTLKRRGKEAC